MLDDRQLRAVEYRSIGKNVTDTAEYAGVSRKTLYLWMEKEEFKAEVGKCVTEFISLTVQSVASYAPTNIKGIVWLAEHAVSEKVRLDARLALLNKTVPNTTKLTLDDTREDSTVDKDMLDGVMDAEDVTD